jgi:hypothetical protein
MQKLIVKIIAVFTCCLLVGCKGDYYQCEYVMNDAVRARDVVNCLSQVSLDYGFKIFEDSRRGVIFIKDKEDRVPSDYNQFNGSSGLFFVALYTVERHAIVITQHYMNSECEYLTSFRRALEKKLDENVGRANYSIHDRTVSKPLTL